MTRLRWKTQEQEEKLVKTQPNQEKKIEQAAGCPSEKPKFSKQGLVIFCDPKHPIYFIESFLRFVKPYFRVSVSTHVHSTMVNFPNELADFGLHYSNMNANVDISLTLIWKTIGIDPIMILPGMHKIVGVVNIARHLNRLVEQIDTNVLKYEGNGPLYTNKIDFYLDKIHHALHDTFSSKSQIICKKSRYAVGEDISIIDLILESIDRYKIEKKN